MIMNKKYELAAETWEVAPGTYGPPLQRVRALKDFGDVKAGDLGGWIEKEENLSHVGDCWVYDDAMVFGEARVSENVKVIGCAVICGQAEICGKATIMTAKEKPFPEENPESLPESIVKMNARGNFVYRLSKKIKERAGEIADNRKRLDTAMQDSIGSGAGATSNLFAHSQNAVGHHAGLMEALSIAYDVMVELNTETLKGTE